MWLQIDSVNYFKSVAAVKIILVSNQNYVLIAQMFQIDYILYHVVINSEHN